MGKSKCRKPRRRRPRPTGIPSLKEMEDELAEEGMETKAVDTILEKLQKFSCEEKECSAVFISQMANNAKFVEQLIERDVVKIAAPLLLHPTPSVKYAICGCLRTLSDCGGPNVPDAMVEQDVMTALITLLNQYDKDWDLEKVPEKRFITAKKIFLEAYGLLTSLCENSSLALEIFNKNNLLPSLLQHLKTKEFDPEINLSLVQCLYTVTENNLDAIQKLSKPENLDILYFFASSSSTVPVNLHLKTLASGVLFNQGFSKIGNCDSTFATAILETIDDALKISIQTDIEKISEAFSSLETARKDKYREEGTLGKKQAALVDHLTNVGHVFTAKQIGLEILTNICCSGGDACDWDETGSCSSASDDIIDSDDISDIPVEVNSNVPLEVRSLIINRKFVEKLLQQIVILDQIVSQQLRDLPEGKDFVKKLHLVRCRALLCANNVIQTLDVDELGGSQKLFQLWMDFSDLVFTKTDSADDEQLEAATSSARAVLLKLAEADGVAAHFNQMNETDMKLFYDIYQKTQDAGVKVNVVRSVATVACILSNMSQPNSYGLIKSIGAFLLEACIKSSKLWITAEALDAIFDVFAEDHVDNIAQEIGLVDKLQTLLPVLKGKIKQRKNALGEHLPVIMTAKANLLRFLKYKNNMT